MNRELYNTYVHILEEELIPAMGCTEPIADRLCGVHCESSIGDAPGTCGDPCQWKYH